jgi:hypothetical protein
MVENRHFPEMFWGQSGKGPDGFGGQFGKFQKKTGRNSLIFWNFNLFRPKPAIIPDQNYINPDFSGNFLRWIRNAPEVKIRPLLPVGSTTLLVWT